MLLTTKLKLWLKNRLRRLIAIILGYILSPLTCLLRWYYSTDFIVNRVESASTGLSQNNLKNIYTSDPNEFRRVLRRHMRTRWKFIELIKHPCYKTRLTLHELTSSAEKLTSSAGVIRATLFNLPSFLVDADKLRTARSVVGVEDFIARDLHSMAALRAEYWQRMLEFGRQPDSVDSVSFFTRRSDIVCEIPINIDIHNEKAPLNVYILKILQEVLPSIFDIFSICYENDVTMVRADALSKPAPIRLVRSHIISVAEGEDLRSSNALVVLAERLSGALLLHESHRSYSYTDISHCHAIILSLTVWGPERDEGYWTEQSVRIFAAKKIDLTESKKILSTQYEAAPVPSTVFTVKRTDDLIEVVKSKREFSPNLKLFVNTPIGTTAIYIYMEGHYSKTAERAPKKIEREIGLGRAWPSGKILKLKNLHSIEERCRYHTASRSCEKFSTTVQKVSARSTKRRSVSKPTKIATIDFETLVDENTSRLIPYMVGIYHSETAIQWVAKSPDEIDTMLTNCVKYVTTHLQGHTIFAHNLVKFDAEFLLPQLAIRLRTLHPEVVESELLTFIISGNSPISFKAEMENIKFLDAFKFLGMSLEKAAISFLNEKKETLPKEIQKVTWKDLKDDSFLDILRRYNRGDCRLLYNILVEFERLIFVRFGLMAFGSSLTIPGLAYKLWKTTTNDLNRRKMYPSFKEKEQLVRSAYRGGRVDVLHHVARATATEKIYSVDFTSLYPAVAYGFELPYGNLTWLKKGVIERINGSENFSELPIGVYLAEVVCDRRTSLPFLGIRLNTGTIYPTGRFIGVYTSCELQYCASQMKHAYRIKLIEGQTFKHSGFLFDQYVGNVYKWKEDAELQKNDGQRATAKLLLNALLGKFGQRPTDIHGALYARDRAMRFQFKNPNIVRDLRMLTDDLVFLEYKDTSRAVESAPQVSVFITALGRIMLHHLVHHLYSQYTNVRILYLDTDSVTFTTVDDVVTADISKAMLAKYHKTLPTTGIPLGGVTNVYNEPIREFQALAPKNYRVLLESGKEVLKHAGFDYPTLGLGGNEKAWQDLLKSKNFIYTSDTRGLNVDKRLRRFTDEYGMREISSGVKELLGGTRAQLKRTFLFDRDLNYVTTRASHVVTYENLYDVYHRELRTDTPLMRNYFTEFPTALDVKTRADLSMKGQIVDPNYTPVWGWTDFTYRNIK